MIADNDADSEKDASKRLERQQDQSLNAERAGFKKHHRLIVMRPAPGHNISLMARKLYNAMLAHTQQHIEQFGMHKASESMQCSLMSLTNKVRIPTGSYRLVKMYVEEFRDWKVALESPNNGHGQALLGADSTVEKTPKQKALEKREDFGFINMMASCYLDTDSEDRYVVSWSFAAEVYKHLEMLNSSESDADRQYVYINLEAVSALGSYAGLALYEICAKFKAIGRVGEKPNDWWQSALTGKPLGQTKREWRKFKNEFIGEAILEINSLTDIEIELIENRRTKSCYFTVKPKRRTNLGLATKQLDAALIEEANKLSISEGRILKLVEFYGETKLKAQLEVLRTRVANTSLPAVRSNYAFLKMCLENVGDTKPETEAEPSIEVIEQVVLKSVVGESRSLETKQTEKEFAVRQKITTQLKSEPRTVIQAWLTRSKESLEEKGFAIPASALARIAEGAITPGVLGTEAVTLYAIDCYGPNWKDQSILTIAQTPGREISGVIDV